MTANWASISRILNQIPIFSALSATALRVSQTNFWASSRISTQLLRRAKSGARGKAATKIVMNPNWRTEKLSVLSFISSKTNVYPFPSILGRVLRFRQVCNLVRFESLQYYWDGTEIRCNVCSMHIFIPTTEWFCHHALNFGMRISWALLITCFPGKCNWGKAWS